MTSLAVVDDFVVRPAVEDDEMNFVRKTWLVDYAGSAVARALGGRRTFFAGYPELRDRAMARGAVTIAGRASVPGSVCGFAVTEERGDVRVVHYAYVKPRWRGMGVARLLLAPMLGGAATYTHRPSALDAARLPPAWTFNPYLFLT